MFEKMLVSLMLADELNLVDGKTRFQELMFLIQKKAKDRGITDLSYDFKCYQQLGPHSFDLSYTIKGLIKEGYLKEEIEITPSGYAKYLYTITDKGRNVLEQAKKRDLISDKIVQIVAEVARKYGRLSFSHLIDVAYNQFNK